MVVTLTLGTAWEFDGPASGPYLEEDLREPLYVNPEEFTLAHWTHLDDPEVQQITILDFEDGIVGQPTPLYEDEWTYLPFITERWGGLFAETGVYADGSYNGGQYMALGSPSDSGYMGWNLEGFNSPAYESLANLGFEVRGVGFRFRFPTPSGTTYNTSYQQIYIAWSSERQGGAGPVAPEGSFFRNAEVSIQSNWVTGVGALVYGISQDQDQTEPSAARFSYLGDYFPDTGQFPAHDEWLVFDYPPSGRWTVRRTSDDSIVLEGIAPPANHADLANEILTEWNIYTDCGSTAAIDIDDLYVYAKALPTQDVQRWWDGSTIALAERLGWWDGAQINDQVELLGWWDGSQIQPVE